MPWRMEERDLLKDYPNYSSHYNAVKDELLEQESTFSRNLEVSPEVSYVIWIASPISYVLSF